MATLRDIEYEGRPATEAEQAMLARWSGWGAVPEVFDASRTNLDWAREQLAGLLTADEQAAAARNTLNAHYTDASIVQAVWAGVHELGFTGGRVLEPGCGSGNFIAFAPPEARVTGVELEPVTAAIAAALYPDAHIRCESFADTRIPDGFFDLAIGNVPFGAVTLNDRVHNRGGHTIHGHFILKSLRLTRPGGIVAVLTSRYTLDARNPAGRREMAELGDLVGAVRLPGGAHQRAAGTDVVTDLLILRRREPGREPGGPSWEQARLADLDGAQVAVSEYFLSNPGHVLGEMRAVRGAYRAGDLGVVGDEPVAPALARVVGQIVADARDAGLTWVPATAPASSAAEVLRGVTGEPDGYLRAEGDGTFTRVEQGQAVPYPVPRTQALELRQLLRLRDTVIALLDVEAASADDTPEMDRLRQELGRRYESYAARFGPVNRFSWRRTGRTDQVTGADKLARIAAPLGGFRADPFAPVVLALEEFDPASQQAGKAAIFTSRVVAPRNPRLGADTPADALAICLDACGEVRLTAVARLLGVDTGQARQELGALVFDDPATGRLVPAAEYLSGMVRDKLKLARVADDGDPRFQVNVEHLTAVIPADLTPAEIDARLGASWIDVSYVADFLREILDDQTVQVEHPGGQVWGVRGQSHTVLATSTWGTARYPAPHLAQAVLEQRRIEVRDKIRDAWVLNLDETIAAQEKGAELAARFANWAWEDPARARDLAAVYNEKLNGIVLRSYDDAVLSLPGLAVSFEPRPHQVAAVARIINEPAVGLFHEVGAGKTAEMTMGAMELRRLGLARKPAIVVPNHMLEQFGREFMQLYPQARILVAQREDLQAGRRHLFVARCATGDWDAVIMSRSAFERIPVSAAVQRSYLDGEAARMREWIERAHGSGGLTVKRLEAAVLRSEERVKTLLDGAKDPGITFEATGIDYLFIDEAHGYKNLRTFSNIPEASIDGSMRASDLDMKIRYLRERNGARVVTFATATPIANSITEAYVMQHYLRPDLLEAAGIEDFDTWAATFAQTVTQIEMAPEAGTSFRQKTRFAKFVNVPEMMRIWHVSADIKTGDDLGLPVPDLARRASDGQRMPEIVLVQPSETLLAYVAELGERADKVRSRVVRPEEDNMLKVSSDGRKAALDLRLVGLLMTGPGKIDQAASRIADIWRDHRDDIYAAADGTESPVRGSLQLVFCDLGTPADGWNVYSELRDRLVALSVPRAGIWFIHEARTDREKGELFAACRAGTVAVLIGSTEKMGVGTNVQRRAIALHHLDCPWRPADIAQREGRILRQGNLNSEVRILRYVTEKSFDAYLFQAVERKARFIAQVMRGRLDVREIEDIGDAALSYSEVKALAAGNPLLMDKAEADAELTRLQRAERAYHRNQDALQWRIRSIERRIEELGAVHDAAQAAIGQRVETRGDAFTMTVGGRRYDKRHDAGEELKQQLRRQTALVSGDESSRPLAGRHGQLGGFELVSTVWRVAGVVVALDGVPECEVSLSHSELDDIDPGKLIVRLENRLHALEAVGARVDAEVERIEAEAARARDDLAKPFPLSQELGEAKDRVQRIGQQLEEAARQPERGRGETSPDATHGIDHVTAEQTQPSRAVATGTPGGPREAVSVAKRGFPASQSVVAPRSGSARVVRLPARRDRPPTVR